MSMMKAVARLTSNHGDEVFGPSSNSVFFKSWFEDNNNKSVHESSRRSAQKKLVKQQPQNGEANRLIRQETSRNTPTTIW